MMMQVMMLVMMLGTGYFLLWFVFVFIIDGGIEQRRQDRRDEAYAAAMEKGRQWQMVCEVEELLRRAARTNLHTPA